jgi:CDP-diacylglycerol--serine O-phosphatidyltransferase
MISSFTGIILSINNHFLPAIFCLIASGLCDMFDGMVARSCKTRSESAKAFGIQIDSLCDLICFGMFPAAFCYSITKAYATNEALTYVAAAVGALLVLCAIIRLGYFNVVEFERQQATTEVRKSYQGLPVTTVAIFLPILFALRNYIGMDIFYIFVIVLLFICAVCFVINIKIMKLHKKGLIVMSIIAVAMIVILTLQALDIIK